MNALRTFEEFRKLGIVRSRQPNPSRAQALDTDALSRRKMLQQMQERLGISDENANYFVEQAYDILLQRIRSHMLKTGLVATGVGSHEAEISYLHMLKLPESDIRFANDLRYFRNGVLYYGTRLDKAYAKRAIAFVDRIEPAIPKSPPAQNQRPQAEARGMVGANRS